MRNKPRMPTVANTVLETLAIAIKHGGGGGAKTFKSENKKCCETIHNIQKFVAFLYTNNGLSEKVTPFIIASKNKIHKNKFNQGSGRPLH